MAQPDSQELGEATTAIHAQPDSKTRRYDRQLRLWAASGQSALESSRTLVIGATATATSILKNLVLPGIGHFTLLDPKSVSPADAGNNFFLNGYSSIGKNRAEEAVPLLTELNDSVDGKASTKDIDELLRTDEGREWIKSFTLVIAHNLGKDTIETLSKLLWDGLANPPLLVVRSAGFLADFYIQFHEQCIIEPHSETFPSLRLTRPFPALAEWAKSTDYDAIDPTDHAHIPFPIILVKETEKWKAEHNGELPKKYADKQSFKSQIRDLQKKMDEENFEEAEAQSWRISTEVPAPSDIQSLFALSPLSSSADSQSASTASNTVFHALLQTLKLFVESPDGPGCLPLTSTLPDVHTDTESYVKLQKMYKEQAAKEAALFKDILKKTYPDTPLDDSMVDLFVKNTHHVKVLRGRRWGVWEEDKNAIASSFGPAPAATATHLALSSLANLQAQGIEITAEALQAGVVSQLPPNAELPSALDDAIGELVRSPTADLPNTAAFLGGMIAQEAIKMITKQYVPVNGYCVIDLVESWTGIVGAP
ncbi:hypothetical protein EUX98_g9034 [Antrodiella citrinella]|uniref:NEDD8-activating enzyme E1 regulatory subunit n=1 Tax=Antrodiella citrinella TaxID=2447956 RepID=A0A4S4M521_9APHY|nr:hypothetical protein EUX98_g9034 [Antrodiella citrinella]